MVTQAEIDIVIDAKNKAQAEITRLKSQLASVSKETAAAGKAMASASSSSSGFASSLKSVASAANPVSAAMRSVTGVVGAATKALGAIGLAGIGIQTVTGAVSGLGNALGFGLQNELEQVRASMNAFFKDSGKTEEALKMVRQEANATPFAFREMAVAMSSLLPAAKQSNTEIMNLVKTAEILAASNPFEGLEGASFSLREAMSGDFTSIIERFNLSRTTINKLKEEGVPNLEIVQKAMQEMGFDADLVAAKAQTLSGRWSTFNDTIDTLRLKLSEKLFEGANRGLDIMAEALNKNMPALERMATVIGEGIGTAISFAIDQIVRFAGAVQEHWGTISAIFATGWDIISAVAGPVFETLIAIIQTAASNIMSAWGPVSSTLIAVWDTIGPKVTAAGEAIITGLSVAQTWITETLLPKLGELSAGVWDTIGTAAGLAATAITDALQPVVDWVTENWPKVKETLSGTFDDLKAGAAPAIEELNRKLDELQTKINQLQDSDSGNFFDDLKRQISEIDFSPVSNAFAPLKAEGQLWVDFVQQDFGPAMSNLGRLAGAGGQAIMDMLPAWASLQDAAKVAGAGVIASMSASSAIMSSASATMRNALQILVDIANGDIPAAFGSAGRAIEAFAFFIPGARVAIELMKGTVDALTATVDALGRAASTAWGFVSNLASGISSAAGAAANALNPLGGVLDLLGKIGGAKGALDFVLPGSLPPLAQGFKDVGEQAQYGAGGLGMIANALDGVGQFQTTTLTTFARSTLALADYSNQLRSVNAALRDLNAKMRDLDLAQALDPENEALKEQIKALDLTIKAKENLASALEDSIAGWNAETFAIDGFVQALDTLNEAGPQALKIQEQFVKALTENDFSSGADLAKGTQKMIADAAQSLADAPELLAPIQALGEQVLAAFRAALEAPSEETINAAMALLANLTTAITDATTANAEALAAAGTLTADTFAKALAGEESKALLGSAGVSLMEALAEAMSGGGVKAIEKAADLTMRMQDELQKLPEFVRGRLGADFKMALDAFVASPTQETLDRLRPVIEQINQTIGLIPKNMENLAPSVVSEIQGIIQAFLDLGLSAEEAGQRIADVMQRAATDAKTAADSVKSATASAGGGGGGGGGGGNTSGLPGSQPLAPMSFANLVALGHAGNADPQVLAALVQAQNMIDDYYRTEQERLATQARQQEALRQLQLQASQAGGGKEVGAIMTELSAGVIGMDEAIRLLMQLLRDLLRNGVKATVAAGEVGMAARMFQTEYERGRW